MIKYHLAEFECEKCGCKDYDRIKKPLTETLRGIELNIIEVYDVCEHCACVHEPFDDIDFNINRLFNAYRLKKDMIIPFEISYFMLLHEMSIEDFSESCGIELSRMKELEMGALQTDQEDKQLKYIIKGE